jgi:hypothetical protein
MADITVTAASVAPHTGSNSPSVLRRGTAGASITAGQSVYLLSSDNTIRLADADASTAAAYGVGIAMHAAASGQPIQYITGGFFTPGATLTKGQLYCVSTTAGGIAPISDTVAATGAHPCILFYAISTTVAFVLVSNMVDTSGTQITI